MSAIRSEMKELSSVERELSVVVPREIVLNETEKAYQRLGQRVRLKGFRQGKVPRSVLEQYYRSEVEQDVTERVLNLAYQEAISSHQLEPVAEPTVENLSTLKDADTFSFTAKIQIRPVITLNKWQGLTVTAPVHVVDESLVDAELEALREQNSTLVPVTDRTTIAQGDTVECQVEATLDGQPVAELTSSNTLEVGSAKYFAEAEQALVGKSVGDAITVSITIPETHPIERLRTQTVSLTITPNAIKVREKPALDDEFAKDVGEQFETLEALKTAIADNLQQEKANKDTQKKEEAVIDALLSHNTFEVPSKWVTKQAEHSAANMLSQFGKEQAQRIWKTIGQSLVQDGLARAERSVRVSLLLKTIAENNGLSVTAEDVEAELDKEAARYNVSKSRIRSHYKKEDLEDLKERILLGRALQLAVESAQITFEEAPLRDAKGPRE